MMIAATSAACCSTLRLGIGSTVSTGPAAVSITVPAGTVNRCGITELSRELFEVRESLGREAQLGPISATIPADQSNNATTAGFEVFIKLNQGN